MKILIWHPLCFKFDGYHWPRFDVENRLREHKFLHLLFECEVVAYNGGLLMAILHTNSGIINSLKDAISFTDAVIEVGLAKNVLFPWNSCYYVKKIRNSVNRPSMIIFFKIKFLSTYETYL